MKIFNKILCLLITLSMMLSAVPANVFAEQENIYTIQNDYVKYTINSETGGFSVETLDGNPQKNLDDKIPLLYKEDEDRSNGTSFATVRINGKDYIFGRSYGFFGLDTKLHTPVVSEGGRYLTVQWDILGYSVIQEVALSAAADSDLTGNVGISYKIVNNNKTAGNVGVRILLDTALDSTVDSPYLIKDTDAIPMSVETEFSAAAGNMPAQIRGVDSLSNPSKMLYTFTNTWSDVSSKVDKIIVGHWRNLANTRYDYTADKYCDFTNYSNSHRFPDSAIAYYWNEAPLAKGESRACEILYGVGNFSQAVVEENIGLNMSIDNKIRLNEKGDGYADDGNFSVSVVVDNSVTDAMTLTGTNITLSFDDGIAPQTESDYISTAFDEIAIGDVKVLKFNLKVEKQAVITSKTVGVTLTTARGSEVVTLNTQRSFIVPGVKGEYPDVKVSSVAPEVLYTEGEKTITVTGEMSPLKALEGNTDGWKMKLYHTTSDHEVEIEKDRIAFLNEAYSQMTFSTAETLEAGDYQIGYEFTDAQLVDGFGVTALKLDKKLNISNDPKYRSKSYALMALVRHNQRDYAFIPFATQEEYNNFLDGKELDGSEYVDGSGVGYPDINGDKIAPFRQPKDEDDHEAMKVNEKEIILFIRAPFKETTDDDGNTFYQASASDGDIIINEVLSYTGSKPLIIKEDNGIFKVSGDGKISVVNGLAIWQDEWFFQTNKDTVVTLDNERCDLPNAGSLELQLGGIGYMVQAIAGFLIDIKYGVMSSSRPVDEDRTLVYGISFGGSISIPIAVPDSAKKADGTDDTKKDAAEDTVKKDDEEDYSDSLKNLFGEDTDDDSGSAGDDEDYSDALSNLFDEEKAAAEAANKTSSSGSGTGINNPNRFRKDTNLDEGLLSVAIDDVRFGQEAEEQADGSLKVSDVQFIGIDVTASLGLPKDVLGSFISNAPGIAATLTINTIDHYYAVEAGVNIKLIVCEGLLSFSMTEVGGKEVVVPDSIQFYIRDGLKIPLVPPTFYMTGLGGGIDNLADTIGGEFAKLPPLTILLFTRLEAVEVLVGDFNASIALSGISLEGDLYINVPGLTNKDSSSGTGNSGSSGNNGGSGNNSGGTGNNSGSGNNSGTGNSGSSVGTSIKNALTKSPVTINAGFSARWIEPASFKGFGSVNVIDGLLQGGITITIAKESFYGYAYVSLCVPDSIPIVGGTELAGVEAAVSNKFFGANLKVLGIKLGFICYWDGEFSIGTGINLQGIETVEYPEKSSNLVFGTNMRKLKKSSPAGISLLEAGDTTYDFTVSGQDSIVIEIPFEASELPTAADFKVTNPDGEEIELVLADDNGNGTYLIQSRDDGNYIYVSVTDKDLIVDGAWTVTVNNTEKLSVNNFDIFGVDNIPEITDITVTRGDDKNSYDVDVEWRLDSAAKSAGSIDVYLTEDKDVLEKIKSSNTTEQDIDPVAHIELDEVKSGKQTITLPDSYESGKYYVAAMLTNNVGGMSTVISESTFEFENKNLPAAIKSAKAKYAGNGDLYVEIEDADNADYTHYLVNIVAEDGATLSNNLGQFAVGEDIFIGATAGLAAGSNYYVEVKTLKEEDGKYYYGEEVKNSNTVTMPEIDKPVLLSVESNVTGSDTNVETLELTYKFDRPVWMYAKINGKEFPATDFKDTWNLTYDLNDGDYTVDFKAYGKNKDYVTGADFPDVENAQMGFAVDNTAPALSLAKSAYETLAKNDADEKIVSQFGSNVVLADSEGNFTVEGITEKSATLTVDGNAVEVDNGGLFTYKGKLGEGETSREMTFKATDKAGNESSIVVFAILADQAVIEKVEILLNGEPIEKNEDGEAVIELKNGDSAELTLRGIAADGSTIEVDSPVWEILYEKNLIEFEDGRLVAKGVGETAVKAGVSNGSVTLADSRSIDMSTEDYVIISILANDKTDLLAAINAAEENIKTPENASASAIATYQAAIDAAKAVYDELNATTEAIEDAAEAMKAATRAFNSAKAGSNSNSSGGLGGSSVKKQYTITVENTENGSVTVSQSKVYSGNSLTITAKPNEGYEVEDIKVNGISYGAEEVVTISAVMENLKIEATFRPAWNNPFIDVTKPDWFYNNVRWAHENSIMKGTADNMFSPNTALTRAMLVTILYRAEGESEVDKLSGFEDVADDAYYAKAVAWAEANGIVKGYSETQFGPDDNILREQIAAIMHRYAQYKKYDVSAGENTNILSYSDYEEISEYAIGSMQYAVGSGLIKGKSDTTLNPKDNATRAEAAAILQRFTEANQK